MIAPTQESIPGIVPDVINASDVEAVGEAATVTLVDVVPAVAIDDVVVVDTMPVEV